ncbi:MAG: MBL fold metallo-hydrolase [Candidatus Hydrogenedentes bacterium]|nr:MBL fold metallo-hydrolase [Candidatus Hydrogenedentota bacterium]
MKLTSFGGAGEVTGSKHIVEINGLRILLDCGLFQGRRQESWEKNRHFNFDVNSIHAVVLSHAHIDHSGLLPMLQKFGYTGCVYATPATRDLCSIMLLDSARIQERDAEWLSKKNMTFMPPLYDEDNVRAIMKRFISVPYDVHFPLGNDVHFTFHDAGHVLGSAMVEMDYVEKGALKRFIFSGDIGRKNMSILEDPWEPAAANSVLMESTYGDRDHDPMAQMEPHLAEIINTTVKRGGKIIVPAFALERAQELVYALKRLQMKNAIPNIPVIVDSPLTVNITEVFRLHTESFDRQFRNTMEESGDPFLLDDIRYIRALKDSIAVNSLKGPAIIISAAGMCEHGRIQHHIKNHCGDPKNTILIIGFQAKNTLGRRIVERQRQIRIFGVEYDLNADVKIMNEFSAHAGRAELIDFALRFKSCGARICLSHGEPLAAHALKEALEKAGLPGVHIQQPGIAVELV